MKRIEWIDIFKGLLIVSMVVGHATGYFNRYIYQFHMAAFFFASGYTLNLSKRTLLETIIYKSYTLLLPYITIFVLMLFFYKIIWWINPELNINNPFDKSIISNSVTWFISEFIHGRVWISVLGATWFLPVLFFSTIFAKILSFVSNKPIILVVISYIISLGIITIIPNYIHLSINYLDLSIFALLFMELGMCFRTYNLIEKLDGIIKYVLFAGTLVGFYCFANIIHVSMDWPSRNFGVLWLDVFVVLNDVYFMIVVSQFLSKQVFVKKGIIFLGKNTMGILLFHFLSFKAAFYMLGESIECFLPPKNFSGEELFFCIIVSLLLSSTLWRLALNSDLLKILFGHNRSIMH